MRFYGTLKLNGFLVGKGYGSNKKIVKNVAARLALKNLTPTLYEQWKSSRGGSFKGNDSSGSDSEQSKKSNSITDILEEVIGEAPDSLPSEGRCITPEEEELEAAKKELQAKENIQKQIQPNMQAQQKDFDQAQIHQKQPFTDLKNCLPNFEKSGKKSQQSNSPEKAQ